MAAEFCGLKERDGKVILKFGDTETMKMVELELTDKEFGLLALSMPLGQLYDVLTAKANEVVERWKRGEQALLEPRKEVIHVAPDSAAGGNTTAH